MKETIFRVFAYLMSFLVGMILLYFLGSLGSWSANPAQWDEDVRWMVFGIGGCSNFFISAFIQDFLWDKCKKDI